MRRRRSFLLLTGCGIFLIEGGCLGLRRDRGGAAAPSPPVLQAAKGEENGPAGTELTEAARLLGTGDRRSARAVYERALVLAEQAGDRAAMAEAWAGIGDSSNPWNDERALLGYQKSLELAEGRQKELARARVIFVTGVADFRRGEIALAKDRFEQVRALAELWQDLPLLARAFHAIGNAASQQGDYLEAEHSYLAGLRQAEKTEDRMAIIAALQSLGEIQAGRGDNALALEHYEKALAVARPLGDPNTLASLHNHIGTIYLAWSDLVRAHANFQEVLAMKPEDESETGYALNNLGIILSLQGESDLGLDYFLRSLAILEKLGEKAEAVHSLANVGYIYRGKGEYGLAQDYFARALRYAEEAGDASAIPDQWLGIASTWEIQKNDGKAREAYRQSLDLSERLGSRPAMARALIGLARLHLRADEPRLALELADRAAAITAESGERDSFWEARSVGGEAHRALGEDGLAREAFEQAILTIEQMRGRLSGSEFVPQSFLAERLRPYQGMIDLAAREGDLPGALAYAESAKGRVLLDILHSRGAEIPQEATAEEVAGAQPGDLGSLTPAAFSALLPDPETALLEYVVLEEKSYLLTL